MNMYEETCGGGFKYLRLQNISYVHIKVFRFFSFQKFNYEKSQIYADFFLLFSKNTHNMWPN